MTNQRAPATLSWPYGTEDRCCFVCKHSSTNPALLDTERWRVFEMHRKSKPHWTIYCFRFGHNERTFGYNACGLFEDR